MRPEPRAGGNGRPTTSTTQTTVAEDSGEILLDPEILGDIPARRPAAKSERLAAGTGETGGTMDELTMAEEQEVRPPPQLAVVRAPPAPPGARQGSRAGSSAGDGAVVPAWIVVQSGSDRGRRFQLRSGRTTIGRGVDNDVVLTDIAVSRRHLVIEASGAGFVMTDLGSGNGTLVNDHDEDGAFPLSHGDRLELGNTVLVFECPQIPARAPGRASAAARERWSREDDEMSTVAGRRSAARIDSPRPGPGPRPGPSAPPPAVLGARPGRSSTVPPLRAPSGPVPAQPGPAAAPPDVVDSSGKLLRQMPSPTSPPVPAAAPGMPTISAEALGLGGPTPSHPSHPGHGSMPAMGSAFSPYPGPAVQYPSLPPGGYSSAGGPAPPRFQYPNGVMAPPPATDRRRLLVGILAIAFVAVTAGIVAALVHGSKDGPEVAKGDEAAEATGAEATGAAEGAAKVQGLLAAGAAAAAAETEEQATGAGSAAPAVSPMATAGGAAPPAPAGGAPADGERPGGGGAEPVQLASLFGAAELGATMFGTDEQFLSDQPAAPPVTSGGQIVAERPAPDPAPKPEAKKSTRERKAETGRKEARKSEKKPERILEEEEPAAKERRERPAADVAAARRQAEQLYRDKDWDAAASALRRAAAGAPRKEASRLETLARSYERVGSLMAEGRKYYSSDAPKALAAFKKALDLDEDHGDGVHDGFIGAQIGQVAPRAAATYIARQKYAEAKRACDDAETYGSGGEVREERGYLERKATELYDQANELAQKGETQEAARLARDAMRLVPRSSSVYSKAARLAKQ